MKLWLSAETQADVGESLRVLRNEVGGAINAAIDGIDCDIGVDGWDCIVILRDDSNLKEIIRFSRKKRDMDFRLRLDYSAFIALDKLNQKRLLFNLLIRSLLILKDKGGYEQGIAQFMEVVKRIGEQHDWL